MNDEIENKKLAFEKEKWEAAEAIRPKEWEFRERELQVKEEDAKRTRRWNPLVVAIIGATVTGIGAVGANWINGRQNYQLEVFKAESARIFEAIKTNNSPDLAAANLKVLLDLGLVQTPEIATGIKAYLASREKGTGIALPGPAPVCTANPEYLSQIMKGLGLSLPNPGGGSLDGSPGFGLKP
jgi:hypothetical protein